MSNDRILYSFVNRVLIVSFLDNAEISRADLEEVYRFAERNAEGKKYGALFEAFGTYTILDDALEFMIRNPYNKNVIAKAYVIDTKEAQLKTKLHLLFDKPELKPFTFPDKASALQWLYRMIIAAEK